MFRPEFELHEHVTLPFRDFYQDRPMLWYVRNLDTSLNRQGGDGYDYAILLQTHTIFQLLFPSVSPSALSTETPCRSLLPM